MAEQNKDDKTDDKNQDDGDKSGDKSNELSAAEERATANGWAPLDDWKGSEDDWVDADTFNERGRFIGQIRAVESKYTDAQREIETLKRMMEHQQKAAANISEREYKRALLTLKKEKSEAMLDAEFDKVSDIDDRIDELKEAKAKDDAVGTTIPGATPVTAQQDATPKLTPTQQEVLNWMQTQEFLKEQDVRSTFAVAADNATNANPNLTSAEIIEQARVHTFNRYTHLGGQKSNKSNVNDGGNRRTKAGGKGGNKFGPSDLNAQERQIMEKFLMPGETLQQAIDSAAANKALEIQNQ